jgi:hypothetical protein
MKIFLDIDGVLVSAASWKTPEFLDDGFYKFIQEAVDCLNELIDKNNASIILISTHRTEKTVDEWVEIFLKRGVKVNDFEKVNNNKDKDKVSGILKWVKDNDNEDFIIIDDDLRLRSLLPIFLKIITPMSTVGLTKNDIK